MIDIAKMRNDLNDKVNGATDGTIDQVLTVAYMLRAALDELEALRKPAATPPDDVIERCAIRVWNIFGNDVDGWRRANDSERMSYMAAADAVIKLADSLRKPAGGVTDAQVEEAACRAWCARPERYNSTREGWAAASEHDQLVYSAEARAVLEYAATLAPTVPSLQEQAQAAADEIRAAYMHVPGQSAAPAVDPRAERLTRYRCAALNGRLAVGIDLTMSDSENASRVEDIAHAMLAAEKEPT